MNGHAAWFENIGATEFVNADYYLHAGAWFWSSGAGWCFYALATSSIHVEDLEAYSVNINMSSVCKYSGEIVKNLGEFLEVGLKIVLSVGNPATAFSFGQLQFVINKAIRVRPTVLLNYDTLDGEQKGLDDQCMWGYFSPEAFYINEMVEGLGNLGAILGDKCRNGLRLKFLACSRLCNSAA
ncbi:Phosphoenolpyruvate synthase [Symbiodinium microadriaticum]|uniref:Phosphoenolpyruvate synthase n=1 Tax=Symbiodinium microadriaticum TaxID=2951 RepID=A0A1Q9F452_SYMMI|nr:Phosphoenolpyruvate synthase [Symbiodinium microadriaticum]CAE7020468.1 ppsA [Symbiodinium sp. KB8]